MIAQARARFAGAPAEESARFVLRQADVMATGFTNGAFDAVVCNRLFHHFYEPETRRAALRELARIRQGPVVVSFFRTLALSALKFWVAEKAPKCALSEL